MTQHRQDQSPRALTTLVAPFLLAAGLFPLALAGCAQQPQQPDEGPAVALAAQSFRREWSADLALKGNDVIERVFAVEDMVFAYSKNQQAFVINRGSGLIRFNTKMTDSLVRPHPPVVLKDKVIFPTASTLEIYRRDGRMERSYKTRNSLRTNAVGSPADTRILFGVDHPGSGRLVCIETTPGAYEPVRQLWELMSDKGAPITSAPAVQQGIAYVAFEDGWVYAVNMDNRQNMWSTSQGPQFRTFGPVTADLRADDANVYIPSTDTKLYCVNRNDGNEKWTYHAGAPLRQSVEVTPTTVYLPVTGRGVVAIDKASGPKAGQPRWTHTDAVKFLAEDEKFAYLQRRNNTIVAIDKTTGQAAFTNQRKDLIAFATNTKGDGLVYAGTKDGQVIAIAPVLKPGFIGEVAKWERITAPAAEALAMK